MKPSHYTTPRQLSDCAFTPSADPIERHSTGGWDRWDTITLWVCVAALVFVGVLIALENRGGI